MSKILLLCIALFVCVNILSAQNFIIGATANLGMSKITSNLPISGDYKVRFTPSGTLGVFLEKRIGAKSFLGAELLWVQMEGKEVTDDKVLMGIVDSEPGVVGVISDQSNLHSSYIGVPFYYRLGLGKLGIKVGVQPMFFLFASSNYKASGEVYNAPYETESETKDIEFEKIDIGPKIGLDYSLNTRFRLRIDYYHGLTDITSDTFPWERQNRQVTMGGQYTFGNRKG